MSKQSKSNNQHETIKERYIALKITAEQELFITFTQHFKNARKPTTC
jgi:hypothetical protein